jgi:hypothetical protein
LISPWFAWAVLAFVVAVIYSFIWPQKIVTINTGFRFLVLRWAHALTWLLLTVNFVLRGLSPSLSSAANILALGGGLVYILFIIMTIVVK